jgi:glycosyltransferase involved in cell wall biosynthesis
LTDPALARSLGEAGRERVRSEFTPERMAERHLALYREVLGADNSTDHR